jgi:RNA polymerase sigma-70 factor (ECF subfamily)
MRALVTDKVLGSTGPIADHEDDRALVRACLAGEDQAQRDLVHRFTPLVFSACHRSGLPDQDAEDVCQQVLLDVLRALPGYRGRSRLSTWIFTVASRRIADYFRSPERRHIPSGGPGDAAFPPEAGVARAGPEEETIRRTRDDRLRQALGALGHPARLILVSYYLGEMPVREIARALKLPEGTVKTHLHRGRRALRKELEKSW